MTQPERIRTVNRLLLIVIGVAVIVIVAVGLQAGAGPKTSDRVVTQAGIHLDAMPDYQAAIFDDGKVTFEEYSRAASDTVSCIRSNGIAAEDPVLEKNQTFSFIVEVPDDEDLGAVDSVVTNCKGQFYSAVELGWADEIRDPEAEGELNEILIKCLADGGVKAEENNLLLALEANPELFDSCTEEARKLTTP